MLFGSTFSSGVRASRRASTVARKSERCCCACPPSTFALISEDALIILSLVLIDGRERIRALFVERAQDGTALAIAQENLYPALGLIETLLALARQAHTLFKELQTLFQRKLAALQLTHDLLKRSELRLETFTFGFRTLFHFNPNQSRKEISNLLTSMSDNLPINLTTRL